MTQADFTKKVKSLEQLISALSIVLELRPVLAGSVKLHLHHQAYEAYVGVSNLNTGVKFVCHSKTSCARVKPRCCRSQVFKTTEMINTCNLQHQCDTEASF